MILKRLRGAAADTPLRIRLVAAVLVLVAVALGAAGFAGTAALRTYLVSRVDSQLTTTAHSTREHAGWDSLYADRSNTDLSDAARKRLDMIKNAGRPVTDAVYILWTDATGGPTTSPDLQVPAGGVRSAPALPRLDAAGVSALAGRPFTASATGKGDDWRVLVTALADGAGAVTVAIGLEDVDNTIHQLELIELVVGVIVLAVLGVLAYLVVRSSLRGLVAVETTTEAIASGDLTQRVPNTGRRSEIGRLASAINTMLAQIEAAFRAQRTSEASARASEERMRRFVADASHELRTPLTSIRGFAELHRQGAVSGPEAVSRMLERIETTATGMGLLVDDLLLLARLDQQRPLERRPVDLLLIAADTVADARMIAPDHAITLDVTGRIDPPPIVFGDESRLRQVATNLMSNALIHTPPGTAVTVRVESVGDDAVLEVADSGPGLPAETAQRVFERFYRADPSRSRSLGGTGLGLAIVAGLVAAHGGDVELDTAPGAGARFRVRLPRGDEVTDPAPDSATVGDTTVGDTTVGDTTVGDTTVASGAAGTS